MDMGVIIDDDGDNYVVSIDSLTNYIDHNITAISTPSPSHTFSTHLSFFKHIISSCHLLFISLPFFLYLYCCVVTQLLSSLSFLLDTMSLSIHAGKDAHQNARVKHKLPRYADMNNEIPRYTIPKTSMTPRAASQIVRDELSLDGNPNLVRTIAHNIPHTTTHTSPYHTKSINSSTTS